MAASTYSIVLENGQTISVYQAGSQAVNSNPAITLVGAAGAGTVTTDFSVMSSTRIQDVVCTTALTAGGFEVYNVTRGVRSSLGISNLESYLTSNTTRTPPKIGFRAGQVYRFIQTVQGNP